MVAVTRAKRKQLIKQQRRASEDQMRRRVIGDGFRMIAASDRAPERENAAALRPHMVTLNRDLTLIASALSTRKRVVKYQRIERDYSEIDGPLKISASFSEMMIQTPSGLIRIRLDITGVE